METFPRVDLWITSYESNNGSVNLDRNLTLLNFLKHFSKNVFDDAIIKQMIRKIEITAMIYTAGWKNNIPRDDATTAPIRSYYRSTKTNGAVFVLDILCRLFNICDLTRSPTRPGIIAKARLEKNIVKLLLNGTSIPKFFTKICHLNKAKNHPNTIKIKMGGK